jgi:hypothetical protein
MTSLGVTFTADRPPEELAFAVDSIAFAPIDPDPDAQLRLLADEILPAFRAESWSQASRRPTR